MLKLQCVGEDSYTKYYKIKKQNIKFKDYNRLFDCVINGQKFEFFVRAYPEILYQEPSIQVYLQGHQKANKNFLLRIRKVHAKCLQQAVILLNKSLR
jgi:hypothetical protein